MIVTVTIFLAAQGSNVTANVRMRMAIVEYVSDPVAAIAPDLFVDRMFVRARGSVRMYRKEFGDSPNVLYRQRCSDRAWGEYLRPRRQQHRAALLPRSLSIRTGNATLRCAAGITEWRAYRAGRMFRWCEGFPPKCSTCDLTNGGCDRSNLHADMQLNTRNSREKRSNPFDWRLYNKRSERWQRRRRRA